MTGVRPEHQTAAYWIERQSAYGPVDEPLLGTDEIRRHNEALQRAVDGEPLGRSDLLADVDRSAISTQVDERLAYLIARADGDTLHVLEAAGDGDAIAGAAGALARGRGLAAVTAPHDTPGLKGSSEITAAKASEVTWAGKRAEDVDLEAIAKAGEPLSGAERL